MDQAEEPLKTTTHQQHPEEGEPHENGASKMFRKVKARAKKFKNSITNHGQSHEHDHDVVEEDDDDDELEPEVIDSPGGVKGKHESLSHPRETNVPAPEEIVLPGTKVFPVVSSDYSKPVEPVPEDTAYGHESLFQNARATDTSAPAHSVRTTDRSDKEERSDVPTHQPLSEREESRETHHESLNTPVSQLSGTEDVPRTFATDEDDHLGGQRKVNFETPKKLEDDPAVPGGGSDYLSGVSDYESKVTDPTHKGSGEAGVPELAGSLGRMNVSDELAVSDEYADQKSGQGFDGALSTRSKEFRQFDQDFDSVIGKDSPPKFGGESGVESEKDFPTRSQTEYGIDKNSPAGFGGESRVESEKDIHEFDMKTESGLDKNPPSRTHEFDLKTESGSPMEIRSESGAELEKELPRGSNEFDQKVGSGRNEYLPESDGGLGAPMGGNFPVRSHELDLKNESRIDKDTPTGFDGEPDFLAEGRPGYGEDPEEKKFSARSDHDVKLETVLGRDVPTGTHDQFSPDISRPKERDETNFPVRSDHDVKLETELGRDVPTGTHDQFSPDISRPKERDEFEESRDDFEETTQEAKPSTYTEKFASMLGYSGEGTVGDQTQVAGTVDEKLTPVNEKERETESAVTTKLPLSGGGSGLEETKETESPVTTKLPLSGGGSGLEETKETESPVTTKLPPSGGGSGLEETEQVEDKDVSGRDYLAEKPTPGEEDKALSEVIAEKLKIGGGEEEKKTTTKDAEVTVEKPPTEKISAVGKHGEAVEEEAKGGEMVGMIKGWFGGAATEEVKHNSPHSVEEAPKSPGWFGGGATEEVKPKSPHSVEESPQSLGSTVGTKGFPDSGGGDLGETGGGGGAVPVQKGL